MMKRFFVFVMLALAALGCKKDPPPQPPVELRWLRIYRDGEFVDSINITGWEVNEDVVKINRYYYPWQGEDSISYSFYLPSYDTTLLPPYSYLNVNGELVGVYPFDIRIESIPCKEEVLTLMRYDSNYKLLPNLVMIPLMICSIDDIEKLDSIPRNIRLDITIINDPYDDIMSEVLSKLSRYRNIRVLVITLTDEHMAGNLSWTRRLCRMRGLRKVMIYVPEGTTEYGKTRIKSRLRCLPKLRAVELLEYTIEEFW